MAGDVALGTIRLADLPFLNVNRDGDVRNAAIGEGGSAGEVHNIFNGCGAHDALGIEAAIHKKSVEFNVLLGEGADEIGKLQAGDGQHGRLVELGVVKSVRSEERRVGK